MTRYTALLLALLCACLCWFCAVAERGRADTFRFAQHDSCREWEQVIDGAVVPATFARCGPPGLPHFCVDTADQTVPYCHDTVAVCRGWRVASEDGPHCHALGCTCDLDGDGAVSLADVGNALDLFISNTPNWGLDRVGVCLDEMRGGLAC